MHMLTLWLWCSSVTYIGSKEYGQTLEMEEEGCGLRWNVHG